jgi:hypothetical protein
VKPSEYSTSLVLFCAAGNPLLFHLPWLRAAMIVQLDQVSRQTISRFMLKVSMSVLIASYGKTGYAGSSGWLGLYAVFAAVAALMLGLRFPT